MTDSLRDALQAGTVDLAGAGHDGQDVIEAYVARPVDRDAAMGGVVVIHHMPGFDEATKEMVRRFASWGYCAICPNLHFREAPGAAPDDAPSQFALNVTGLGERLPDLRAPLLGLFGREDSHPSPEEVAELDRRLTELGKEHELHSFEDAGHAFFAVDRPSYRPAAATEGWALIRDFFARHLAAAA